MGTRIYFSHRLETLADALASVLVDERDIRNPFKPSTIIVPNSNTKRWLQLHISQADGIAANINYPLLHRGLWDLLEELLEDPGLTATPCQLRPDRLSLLVLALVQRHASGDSALVQDLTPLTFLLYDGDGNPRRNFAGRLWMISSQLSQYFEAYEFERPEMVRAWLRGELGNRQSSSDPEVARLERCQMAIYRAIFGPGGLRDGVAALEGEDYMTLPQFAARVFSRANPPTILPTVHLFGLSQISSFHRDLLFRLSHFINLHIYQLNVCSEFWEDITTEREDRWLRMRDRELLVNDVGEEELGWDDDENMLLKWWGKPGRETVRLLSELETQSVNEMNLEVDWLEPEGVPPKSVLEMVQSQVVRRTQLPPDQRLLQDRSLQIFAAPGIFREVETIHESIQQDLADDPSLMQTDITILVPDINAYKPVIADVFNRKPRPIGYNLTESRASRDSVYAHAVNLLLGLADGSFSRRQVFELILNPCFLAGCGITRQDALIWAQWADNLQIFHSFDAKDKEDRGYGNNRLYTWQQGLQRLRLGRIMQAPRPVEDLNQEPPHYHGLTPYSDMASADSELVGKFSLAVETLFRRIQQLTAATMSCAQWVAALEETFDRYLSVPQDRPEEDIVRRRLIETLREQSLLDSMHRAVEWEEGIDYALAAEMVTSALDDIASRHGSFLSGGVNVMEIRADRTLPFEIVYIAGLREGQFPGPPDFSTLDLRRPGRRIGDVSPPERGRYSILEALMSTRSRLYLSYVSKDLQKDQEFYPCSIIIQLMSYLERSVLAGPFAVTEIPASGASLQFAYDDATNDSSDVMVTHNRTDQILRVQSALAHDDVQIADADRERLATWLATATADAASVELPSAESQPRSKQPGKHALRLTHLRRFLENPMESSLQYHLGLYEYSTDPSDVALLEDEPFFSQRTLRNSIIDRVVTGVVRSGSLPTSPPGSTDALEAMVEQVYEDFRRRSLTPDGVFSRADRQTLVQDIRDRLIGPPGRRRIGAVLDDLSGCEFPDRVAIGEPEGVGAVGMAFPPLSMMNGRDEEVEIHGTLPFIWRDSARDGCNVLWVTHDNAYQRDFPVPRQLLTPYLFYVTCLAHGSLACSEFIGSDVFTIYWSNRQGLQHYRYHFKRDRARDYLQSLVHNFYADDAFDLLPYEVVGRLTGGMTELPVPMRPGSNANEREKGQYRRRLEHEIEQELDNPYSQWYHSRLLTVVQRTVPGDAWDKIKQRLAPFHETH